VGVTLRQQAMRCAAWWGNVGVFLCVVLVFALCGVFSDILSVPKEFAAHGGDSSRTNGYLVVSRAGWSPRTIMGALNRIGFLLSSRFWVLDGVYCPWSCAVWRVALTARDTTQIAIVRLLSPTMLLQLFWYTHRYPKHTTEREY